MRIKQIEESKTLITDAFFALLKENDFEVISMSMIADHAGVSRMTLYRHFPDKSDIARAYIDEVVSGVFGRLRPLLKPDFYSVIYERNQVIYHDERIRLALQHDTLETIYKEAVQSNRSKFLRVLPSFLKPQPYQELFIMGGINSLTHEWVHSGLKESPEEITTIMMGFMRSVIQG
jgi:AcrR family transcriptional regulator